MPETIGHGEFVAMLRGAVRQIEANHETLSELDTHGGDGDHGSTMLRAMAQVRKAVESAAPGDLNALLRDIGWTIMGIDGGATGPLLGTFFMSMADAAGADALDAPTLAAMFESGLAGVRKHTRAQVGDKTMIDALAPAVETLSKAASEGADCAACLERAAAAAEQGAESTAQLRARFGRAKNLGDKSVGSKDPGAASIALIFAGLREGLDSDA